MCANAPPEGVFQVDMNSRLVSHRQIPLGQPNDGGGCHGAMWNDGKLWIAALRLRGILRVDPETWQPEFMIPFYQARNRDRYHAIAWDNGAIWQVIGNDSKGYKDYLPGLVKYDSTPARSWNRRFRAGLIGPARAGDARRNTHQLRCRDSSRLAE